MRRFICATLLIAFCLQSTGIAATGSDGMDSARSTFVAMGRALDTALNHLATSPLLAMVIAPERFAAMHAPAPVRPKHVGPLLTASEMRTTVRERPANWRSGTPITAVHMLERPLLPKNADKLRPPITSSGTARSSSSITRASVLNATARSISQVLRAPRQSLRPMDVTSGSPNNTGFNPWWTFTDGTIPGVGKSMINVGNGNLIVQSDDVDVPERGVHLAFRRTYNSMSARDWNSDDGSPTPGQYGDGWTNSFDTHLAANTSGGISVYDVDGARYDYAPSGTGCLTKPIGTANSLCWDGGCGYQWTKKDGTVYYFWEPSFGAGCDYWATQAPAYAGRLYMIFGRNNNNWVRLTYSWVGGNATSSANLTQISAAHQDGQSLTLNFAAAASGAVLLSSLVRPDGASVTYSYDSSNDLTAVTEVGNGSGNSTHAYGWTAGHLMSWAAGPRYTAGGWGGDGGYVAFSLSSAGVVNDVWHVGIMDFTPPDGTGVVLQQGFPTTQWTFADDHYAYSSGSTSFTDWDGHGDNWYYDSGARVTQTQKWTGAIWLVTYATWDTNNNLIQTIDERGNASDYAYDANGNLVAAAYPAIATDQGTFRPTALYSYDVSGGTNYNNVVAYCDARFTHQLGRDWTSNPGSGDSLCPSQNGAARYVWDYSDSSEPFGRITDIYNGVGYHQSLSYSTTAQGGDFGLLSDTTGDSITQVDGSVKTPHETLTYDANGNPVSYSKGTGFGATTSTYDSLNRLLTTTDADGVSSYHCYNPDGSLLYSESARQHLLDGSPSGCQGTPPTYAVSYTYDPDSNVASEVHHFGNTAGTTARWYDGADRLVEVKLPQDPTDVFQNAWITRNLYDLTQGGTVSLNGSSSVSYRAYGNSFKRQELLTPGATAEVTWASGQAKIANTQFQDTGGAAFDALDRVTKKYAFVNDVPNAETFTFDGNGYYGQVSQHCNASNQCGTPTYDAEGHLASMSYNDSTPSEQLTYTANGRPATIQSGTFGTQSYTYDQDGHVVTAVEPSSGGVTSPATVTYHYYPDGSRSALDVSSSALNQTSLLAYSYRADGPIKQMQINLASDAAVGNSALNFTYTNADRLLQRTESGPAANASSINYTYDINNGSNTGSVTTLSVPAAALSGFTYDAEGEVLSYTRNVYNVGTTGSGSFSYTTRGDMIMDPRPPSATPANFANGLSIVGTAGATWDERRNTITNTQAAFSFDASGRQTGSDITGTDSNGNDYDTTDTRTYDGEGRLTGGNQHQPTGRFPAIDYYSTLTAYNWGPNGHEIQVGSTPKVFRSQATTSQISYDTLHWDGDQLLFTTNAQGQVDDIKIDNLGDITPLDSGYSGLTFWDRVLGSLSFCHNASGAAGGDSTSNASPCPVKSGQTMQAPVTLIYSAEGQIAGGVGQGKILGMTASGALADGVNAILGAHAYDGMQSSWTTPDSSGGNLLQPATMRAYATNTTGGASQADHCTSSFCYGPPIVYPGIPSAPWIPSVLPIPDPSNYNVYTLTPALQVWANQVVGNSVEAAGTVAGGGCAASLVTAGISCGAAIITAGGTLLVALGWNAVFNHNVPPGFYVTNWQWKSGNIYEEHFFWYPRNGYGATIHGTATYDVGRQITHVVWFVGDSKTPHQVSFTPAGVAFEMSPMQALASFGAYDTGVSGEDISGMSAIVGGYNNNRPL